MHKAIFLLARGCHRMGLEKPAMGLAALAGIFQVFGVLGTFKLVYRLKKEMANDRRSENA